MGGFSMQQTEGHARYVLATLSRFGVALVCSLSLPTIATAAPIATAVPTSVVTPTATAVVPPPSFVTFESGQVRPLAISPDGDRLFAVNTPDDRLEILAIGRGGLAHLASVPVGMEPVAVAVRSRQEVWVVNHLSDSVSIVDVGASPPHVVRTLLVGDEPRDIVFAGDRAFITTAHRGQQRTDPSIASVPGAGDPQLTTPGIGRADVWVFDAAHLGDTIGGTPLKIVELFGDTPRALAVSPDGGTVFVAVFNSGNQTTTVSEGAVCDGFEPSTPCTILGNQYPGGNPGPATNYAGVQAPEVGLIVKFNVASGHWEDETGRNWDNGVQFQLADEDVFAIDAGTLQQTAVFTGVGTTLFNMAVNPRTGHVYVSNTDSHNEVRFEGPGQFGGSTVQGHLAEADITILADGVVKPRHLNKHIDYTILPAPAGTNAASLAIPLDMVVSSDGQTLYVAAFGSGKVGVFDTVALENDTFDPMLQSAHYIPLSGGGPSGLMLDETRQRLYVLTRFDDAVSAVDLTTSAEIDKVALHNPEPAAVVQGRPFLYDAAQTSSNGEASCASCHVFGDMDHLAWDLGNPDADVTADPIPIRLVAGSVTAPSPINGTGNPRQFNSMKGPMTTQTLRGMVNDGAMHWRGDRSVGVYGTDAFSSDLSFRNFNAAFVSLLGGATMISDQDMQTFTDFALALTLPPNPIRNLDNSLTTAQAAGQLYFLGNDGPDSGGGHRADGVPFLNDLGFPCHGCHVLAPENGSFGTDGEQSFENETQIVKIPHLRNLYQKVGMFGMPAVPFLGGGDNGDMGDQIRGFGFLHDGSVDTLFRFLNATVFESTSGGTVGFFDGDPQRRSVEQYLLAFDSDLAPIVGQQVTLDAGNGATVGPRIDLMIQRAGAPFTSKILGTGATECDLIAKAPVGGRMAGFVRLPTGLFAPDDGSGSLSDAELRALASTPGQEVTYTCVPPGSGERAGVDRDGDGVPDGVDNCPDVANPTQTDSDGDGVGDACDNCPNTPNPDQFDRDANGIGDRCDYPIGDCNLDRTVTVNELVTGVGIALGETSLARCTPFDPNGDQRVTVDELIAGVDAALGSL